MDAISFDEATRHTVGAVLVDNLTFASVHRLLYDRYASLETVLRPDHRRVGEALIAHDVANLANLLDILISADRVYVNPDFTSIWRGTSGGDLQDLIGSIVTGVALTTPTMIEIERAVAADVQLRRDIVAPDVGPGPLSLVSDVVYGHCFSSLTPDGLQVTRRRMGYFAAANGVVDEAAAEIGLGLGYYLACSQLIGVPFRPSVLRATMLRRRLTQEINSWHRQSRAIPLTVLERSAEAVTRSTMQRLHAADIVDRPTPATLAFILHHARGPEDVIPLALQIRDSHEGRAYRRWAGEFAHAVQHGSIRDIARFQRQLGALLDALNRRYRLVEDREHWEVSLGWGPLQVTRSFSFPSSLSTPIRIKRHLWVLHHLYRSMLTTPRWTTDADRVLIDHLPSWLNSQVKSIDWSLATQR